jgi:glycine reductase
MRLELGTFPVREAHFGARTAWADGWLEIDREAVLRLVRSDPHVAFADVGLTRPGESARIVNIADVLEPRVKVSGGGVVYPGICGRPRTTVGRGRTHRLGGFAVVECYVDPRPPHEPSTFEQDGLPRAQTERRHAYVDMSGPGAVRPYAATIDLVLTIEPVGGLDPQDRHLAVHGAALRVSDHLPRRSPACSHRRSRPST